MPIYEYICEDCQTHFEKIVLNKTQELPGPKWRGEENAISSPFSVRRMREQRQFDKGIRWVLRGRRQLLRRRMRCN